MAKLSKYTNEILSLAVMLLMTVALVAGEADAACNERAKELAGHDAGQVEIRYVRLEDE